MLLDILGGRMVNNFYFVMTVQSYTILMVLIVSKARVNIISTILSKSSWF